MIEPRAATPSLPIQALMFTGAALVMLGNYYAYDCIAPVAVQLSRVKKRFGSGGRT